MSVDTSENPVSSGVVILRRIDGDWHYLLLRAFQYWDFPKGLVEEGESEFDAAVREVEEESTLTGLDFRWGFEFFQTAPYGRFRKIAHYYIAESVSGEVDLPVSEELGRPEHEEFCWVRFDDAYAMVAPRVKQVLDWSVKIVG